jgi:hypothetical protein
MDAVHDRLIWLEETGVARSPVGTVGTVVSPPPDSSKSSGIIDGIIESLLIGPATEISKTPKTRKNMVKQMNNLLFAISPALPLDRILLQRTY